ncbi:hypothetical protein ACP70R_004504 [Stipagrostis hirtigluma subsp. patula]
MYRTPRPRSRADGGAGMLNHAASRLPFPQFAQGRNDPEARRSEDEAAAWSSLRQMPQGFQQPKPRRGEGIISDVAGLSLMQRPGVHALGLDGGMSQQQFSQEEEVAHDSSAGAMGSGSYLTDLLGSEVQESQDLSPTTGTPIDQGDLSPTTGTPIDQGHAAAKGSQGRTKNSRDEEDGLLVSAWLNVIMDPIQGVDQSQTSYWARIHEYFHANKSFESDRTQGSLMNRWSGIQHDVNVFCGCVTRIEDRNQSGCSVDDKIAHACALFKEEDKKNRKFNLMHCWRILKDKPKWMERRREIGTAKAASNKKIEDKGKLIPIVSCTRTHTRYWRC